MPISLDFHLLFLQITTQNNPKFDSFLINWVLQIEQPVGNKFVNRLEIIRVLPCLADPDKIRFTAEFDREVSDVFPFLNALLKGAIYNHAGKSLTLRKDGRLITLYPKRVVGAKIDDYEDARKVIDWLVNLINECDRKRDTIEPNYERRTRLNVIDVVRLLPGTNCKKCRQPTCLSFAALVTVEKASILSCPELFLVDYKEKRDHLFALLRAGGYSIPDAFH